MIYWMLSAIGMACLVVLPEEGPGALWREEILRPLLSKISVEDSLDCVKCCSFWCAAAFVGPMAMVAEGWWAYPVVVFGSPGLIWMVEHGKAALKH